MATTFPVVITMTTGHRAAATGHGQRSRSLCAATPPPGIRTQSTLNGASAASRRTRTRTSPSSHPWPRRSGLDATSHTHPTSACRGRRSRPLHSAGHHPSRCQDVPACLDERLGMTHCFLVQRVRRHLRCSSRSDTQPTPTLGQRTCKEQTNNGHDLRRSRPQTGS